MTSDLALEPVPFTSEEEAEYQHYHHKRFVFALQLIKKLNIKRALEIGPYMIAQNLVKTGVSVDTMGYISNKITGTGTHFTIDLDELGKYPEKMLNGDYELVIASEVIEHLHLDLDRIFVMLNKLTRIGGIVLIQTPNAVALKKRGALFFGKNPFELIRSDYQPGHGGHIREFTMTELVDYAKMNGFEVVEKYCSNYFDYTHSIKARLYEGFCNLIPSCFRDGITIVLKKISASK